MDGFEKYIRSTKDQFIRAINSNPQWTPKLRTQAETLIIAYDHMMDSLFDNPGEIDEQVYYNQYIKGKIANGEIPLPFEEWEI